MPDNPDDTQAQRMPGGKPKSEGLAHTPQDTVTGAVKPQGGPMDRPGTEAEDSATEPVTNEPVPVAGDDPDVGLSEPTEPKIEGNRGM